MNADEKALMKLWNQHIESYPVVPDRLVPRCCLEFSHRFAAELRRRRLRNNYALHLINLYNFGLIATDDIRACLHAVDNWADNIDG